MAGREGFYMTLISDGSMESFPNNTGAQFKTLLPQALDLTDGEWEVGLTEMMYSTSLKNISDEEAYFDILVPHPKFNISRILISINGGDLQRKSLAL